jgi:hypothetical protein
MQAVTLVLGWLFRYEFAITKTLEITGFLVGVIALIVAAKEFRHVKTLINSTEKLAADSQQIVSDSKKLLDTSTGIAESMSTRFVGQFPYNLNDLSKVLGRAASHVEIMVDIVAYGHYSSPEAFQKYFDRLSKIAINPDVNLRMIVYGEKLNEQSRQDQFGGEQHFAEIKKDPKFDRYFPRQKANDIPTTYGGFIGRLADRENLLKQTMQAGGADIRESSEQFRFFLWLIDDVEAVFSFQMYGEHFHEICFRTRDGNLIRTFSTLFEHGWKSALHPQLAA